MLTKKPNGKQTSLASHIVLRLSAKVSIRSEKVDTISAHNLIFDQAGHIAVGKFGKAWSAEKCSNYCRYVTKSKRLLLIIVTRSGKKLFGWSAPLEAVFLDDDKKAGHLARPRYYDELAHQPSLLETAMVSKPSMWFVVTEKFKLCSLSNLWLTSNGRRLSSVLRETRTAMMLVTGSPLPKLTSSEKSKP